MTSIPELRRAASAAILFLVLGAGFPSGAVSAEVPLPTDDQILRDKCSVCHEGHRIYRMQPDQIRAVLDRMRRLDPDFITTADTDHLAQVVLKVLNDPSIVAERNAWLDAVDRGGKLFADPGLGTNGKSCSSCHAPATFKNADKAFPKFSPELKRFVDIQEWINLMITGKMKGTALPPFDQRYLDLVLYIKSLK